MEARDLIRREYGGSSNFITPDIIEYGWIVEGEIAYELSSGSGLLKSDTLWGVSTAFLMPDGTTRRGVHDTESGCFMSRGLARRFIARLRNEHSKGEGDRMNRNDKQTIGRILADIKDFEKECEESEHTDAQSVIDLLERTKKSLKYLLSKGVQI